MKLDAKAALRRVAIEGVSPEVDAGRFPVKRAAGEHVVVEADVFADGHDELAAVLRYRHDSASEWTEVPMHALGNDRWTATFTASELGSYRYTIEGWTDRFLSWRRDIRKWLEAGTDVSGELEVGARLVEAAAKRAKGDDRKELAAWAARLRDAPPRAPGPRRAAADEHPALDEALASLANAYPDRRYATRYERELYVVVDRPRARFSAWYELFPRSAGRRAGRHGTFADVERAARRTSRRLGFDVLYLPPIHPIGRDAPQGPEQRAVAQRGRRRAARGRSAAPEGGHTADPSRARHARRLRRGSSRAARAARHRARARHRLPVLARPSVGAASTPSGSGTGPTARSSTPRTRRRSTRTSTRSTSRREDWRGALGGAARASSSSGSTSGVRIFRVDNPHTKPFAFWEWMIAEVQARRIPT